MLTYYFPRFQPSCRVIDDHGHPHLLLTEQQVGVRHCVIAATLQAETIASAQSLTTGHHPKYRLTTNQPVGQLNARRHFNYLPQLQWQIWAQAQTITIRRWHHRIATIKLTATTVTIQINHPADLGLVAIIAIILHPERFTPQSSLTNLNKRLSSWRALPCPTPSKTDFTMKNSDCEHQ